MKTSHSSAARVVVRCRFCSMLGLAFDGSMGAARVFCGLAILAIANFVLLPFAFAQEVGYENIVPLVEPRVVKITGSGGFRRLEAYQSGFLVSDDGYILTVWSYVLDTDSPQVTLSDGQRFDATLVGYDPRIEIAVLKIDAGGLACFNIDSAVVSRAGARVLAFSNLFGVATGDEPVSVIHGHVAAITSLNARSGARESTYQGDVYILDAITNNPGAAGGAVTNRRGELIGLVGKELRDSQTGMWLNFCIPIGSLAGSAHDIRDGKMPVANAANQNVVSEPMTMELLGIVLVPDVIARTPPFVDRVVSGSVASDYGLEADDLIVEMEGQVTPSCRDVVRILSGVDRDERVSLTFQRENQFLTVEMELER